MIEQKKKMISASYPRSYSQVESTLKSNLPAQQSKPYNARRALTITLIVLGVLAVLASIIFAVVAIATAQHLLWIGCIGSALAAVVLFGATLCTAKNSRRNDWTFQRTPHDIQGALYAPDDYRRLHYRA